ncbi:MAG: cation:proton antiporter [Magnetococcus sp. WYHC-3]
MTPLAIFFVQTLFVVSLPYLVWGYGGLRRFFPLVVVQILAGIVVGPAILGQVAPDLWAQLFPSQSIDGLKGLAWLAVVLFSFLTGLHLQPEEMRTLGGRMVVVSLASFAVPALLGGLAGLWIADVFPGSMGGRADSFHFAMGVGICCGVTALPVLGAILRELGLLRERMGRFALGAAAINDAVLWILLLVLLFSLSHQGTDIASVWRMLVLVVLYFSGMWWVVRPLLVRLNGREGPMDEMGLVLVCTVAFLSALVTEMIGLHAALGAFTAGVILPRGPVRSVVRQLGPITVVVLVPFFFTINGMSLMFEFGSADFIVVAVLTTVVSMAGKIGGSALAARALGESWSDALSLGALMQTKGMMEVVVLTILLDAGVVSHSSFSAMLVMALFTTAMAAPMLHMLRWFHLSAPVRRSEAKDRAFFE